MSWADKVFKFLPPEFVRPASVTVDGKGGYTQPTFDSFVSLSIDRVEVKLLKHTLTAPDWTLPLDEKLEAAVAQVVAGYVLRGFAKYENLSKDLFASGFATLDDYITEQSILLDGAAAGPEFVDDPADDETNWFPKL